MYINIISNGKYKYVYINESYRENGKTKTRHVQKVGRYDLLEAKDPNFLEKLKAQYEEPRKRNEELKEEKLNAMVASLRAHTLTVFSSIWGPSHPSNLPDFFVLSL